MKRFPFLALALVLLSAPAFAATQAGVPSKFPIPWGNSAGSSYIHSIPQPSQIGITNCAASLTDGFPPLSFTPATAGGCPPFGQDFNGILRIITQWNQWQQMGGPIFYDSGFASSIGGYPNGAILLSAVTPGTRWMSTADNNTTNPDAFGANWIQDPGQVPIGTPLQSLSTTIPTGYVSANGLTVGNAASNATDRANADTLFLFNFLWNNCPNTQCPIYTSAGSASVRGASAAADYAANEALATPNMNGTALMGADSQNGATTTNLVSVPVQSGSRTAPTSILGENLHVLTVGELATHNHTLTDPGHSHSYIESVSYVGTGTSPNYFYSGISGGTTGTSTTGITIAPAGSNTAHNTVPRSTIVYWNLKL